MIIAGTGHRPKKLLYDGDAYSMSAHANLVQFAQLTLSDLSERPTRILSGMAMGWDMALADAAVNMGIPFIAALPCNNQSDLWSIDWKELYRKQLELAEEVVHVCAGAFAPWKMQARNEYLTDNCDLLLALWDGTSGGTKNCIQYAERIEKPVKNVWEDYKKWHYTS